MSVPPAQPRRRAHPRLRDLLYTGMWLERVTDRSVWQVRQVWPIDRRAQLAPDSGGEPISVPFATLEHDYRQADAA